MLIRNPKSWDIPERETTPEHVFMNRRHFLAAAGFGAASLSPALAHAAASTPPAAEDDPSRGLYPARRNETYKVDQPLTREDVAANYNNFYEFGFSKSVADAAQALKIRPWSIRVDGLVSKERDIAIDDLLKQVQLEERIYRFRCVEAWSMTVPWTGFPLKRLVELAEPKPEAKYLRFETFLDPKIAPGQRMRIYPWPYVEGLSLAEASHDLAFMATGIYGKPMPKQHGAPIRLVTPWKYGFKSIKSVVRISFTAERPKGLWEELQASEYGFWANVNPKVAHPRWSQATEEVLGTRDRRPTLLYNGYEAEVAGLYKGLENEKLFM